MIYIITCLFTMAFVYYSKYQFINGRAGKWHMYGATMRMLMFLPFLLPKSSIPDIVLAGVINCILFDVGINLIALNKPWYYTGSTNDIDNIVGKGKWYIYGILLILAITLKFFYKD